LHAPSGSQEYAQRILSGAVKPTGARLEALEDSKEELVLAHRVFTKLRGLPAARTRMPPKTLDSHITFVSDLLTKAEVLRFVAQAWRCVSRIPNSTRVLTPSWPELFKDSGVGEYYMPESLNHDYVAVQSMVGCHGANAVSLCLQRCARHVLDRPPFASYRQLLQCADVLLGAQVHVEKARRDLELLETKRHAAELRMRESQAKEAAEAARRSAAEQVERDRQQARPAHLILITSQALMYAMLRHTCCLQLRFVGQRHDYVLSTESALRKHDLSMLAAFTLCLKCRASQRSRARSWRG